MTSSPLRPGASLQEELDYYKKQYEQLEADLADFQASSKELEEQLEKDIDNSEKSERKLKGQVEKLGFEVEEWKGKHKQAKTEANNAQNTLQKEITSMREQNRSLSLKLRDIEVANDDFERQARNTNSSLEDLEGKLNVAIERGVLLESEVKAGEQEREALRIETQRLRDELGDLKVESEIRLEKLTLAESTIQTLRARKPSPLAVENLRTRSPGSEASGGMTPGSPTTASTTPPPRSDTASEAPTPPSPPLSDTPLHAKSAVPQQIVDPKTPMPMKRTSLAPDATAGPRSLYRTTSSRHMRNTSLASTSTSTSYARSMKPPPTSSNPTNRPRLSARGNSTERLPRSDSLHQMKTLRSRMQKIEERVQSARSKLPAPRSGSTPRNSPRTTNSMSAHIPSTITVRRSSKRVSRVATPSLSSETLNNLTNAPSEPSVAETPSDTRPPSARESHIKRLSYGIPRAASSLAGPSDHPSRPPSTTPFERPPSSAASSRPQSRISVARPESRSGARSSFSQHPPTNSIARPRSSMGGPTPQSRTLHRHGASVSELGNFARPPSSHGTRPTSSHGARPPSSHGTRPTSSHATRPPSSHANRPTSAFDSRPPTSTSVSTTASSSLSNSTRRTTIEKSGLPAPKANGPRRQSGVEGLGRNAYGHARRGSTQTDMKPPATMGRRRGEGRTSGAGVGGGGGGEEEDVGETY